jgi:FMN phosphatase YigB (HAD superfamily)
MRIGIDFDNTIACYNGVFHRAAVERGLVPETLACDKTSVRNYLRGIGREDDWTELQGYIYGLRMDLVSPYPGAIDFMRAACAAGHDVFIVSHKSRHPYIGERHDLHKAAQGFLAAHGVFDADRVGLARGQCYFELTLPEKLERIAAQSCDMFIDDLPEFLAEPAFPATTQAILFDPENHYPDERRFPRLASWSEISGHILGSAA